MPVDDPGDQASANEIDPVVGVGLGAGEAKGRFTSQGDGVEGAAIQAAKSGVSHFLGITTVKHLVDDRIVVRCVVPGVSVLELQPMIAENLFELLSIDVCLSVSIAQCVTSFL